MKKIKLTNTWKHAVVALIVGLITIAIHKLIHLDPNAIFEMGWFALIVFSMVAMAWEANQKNPNWIDTAADLIAGIGALTLTLWIGGVL
jgi:hypothetical protein